MTSYLCLSWTFILRFTVFSLFIFLFFWVQWHNRLPSGQWQHLCSIPIIVVSYTCGALTGQNVCCEKKVWGVWAESQSHKRFHSHSTRDSLGRSDRAREHCRQKETRNGWTCTDGRLSPWVYSYINISQLPKILFFFFWENGINIILN